MFTQLGLLLRYVTPGVTTDQPHPVPSLSRLEKLDLPWTTKRIQTRHRSFRRTRRTRKSNKATGVQSKENQQEAAAAASYTPSNVDTTSSVASTTSPSFRSAHAERSKGETTDHGNLHHPSSSSLSNGHRATMITTESYVHPGTPDSHLDLGMGDEVQAALLFMDQQSSHQPSNRRSIATLRAPTESNQGSTTVHHQQFRPPPPDWQAAQGLLAVLATYHVPIEAYDDLVRALAPVTQLPTLATAQNNLQRGH